MKKYSMPYRVTDIGIEPKEEIFYDYYDRLKNSSAINAADEEECARLELSLRYLWNIE